MRPQDVQIFERFENGQRHLAGMLHIFTSKTGRPRNVPLNPIAASIAQDWLQRATGKKWLLPPYDSDKRFICANNWANRRFKPSMKAAGIEGMTFHLLRHTFATRALQGGARLEQISWALGHASTLETESRYAHWGTDQVWPAVQAVMNPAPCWPTPAPTATPAALPAPAAPARGGEASALASWFAEGLAGGV